MTTNDIQDFFTLTGDGSALNGYSRIRDLWVVGLDTDGNQFYTPSRQKIWFDADSQLVRIKYSALIPASAFVRSFSYNIDGKYVDINVDTNGSPYLFGQKMRFPEVDDYLCFYDTVTKTDPLKSRIVSISRQGSYLRLTFASDTFLTEIAGNPKSFFILRGDIATDSLMTVGGIPARYYTEGEETGYPADIYIGFDKIASLDFNKRLGMA